ncbi:MAG TPA: Hsp20/alpha crystallin family protein [Vicinamibacterales bacterium]|nr:Hsp20/alpha crystallin family protein [Vicinamibacterales bacterium]
MARDSVRDLRAWQERLERLTAQNASAWTPPIDVYETEDRYVIAAELPGLSREQIELAVQENRLTIRGTRQGGTPEPGAQHYHQVERGHGSFQRAFEFADRVQTGGVTADLRDGVLTVTLPKLPSPPRRVEVS